MTFNSLTDWDLSHEDGWEVVQRTRLDDAGKPHVAATKVWCSPSCKERQ